MLTSIEFSLKRRQNSAAQLEDVIYVIIKNAFNVCIIAFVIVL